MQLIYILTSIQQKIQIQIRFQFPSREDMTIISYTSRRDKPKILSKNWLTILAKKFYCGKSGLIGGYISQTKSITINLYLLFSSYLVEICIDQASDHGALKIDFLLYSAKSPAITGLPNHLGRACAT